MGSMFNVYGNGWILVRLVRLAGVFVTRRREQAPVTSPGVLVEVEPTGI